MKNKIFIIYIFQVLALIIIYFSLMYFIGDDGFVYTLIQSLVFAVLFFVGLPLFHELILRFKKPNVYQLQEDETVFVDEEVRMFMNTYLEKIHLQVTNQNLIWTYSKQSKVKALEDLNDVRVKKDFITFHFKHQKLGFFTENAQAILNTLETERQNSNLSCT